MKFLVITNYKHKVSKEFIKYLKFKKINFDHIDSGKNKKIDISKKYEYLISFLNSHYINNKVRNRIRFNSFNFHPGPPEYPGFGCYNFALLDEVNFYGSTIHLINDKFDNGKIINVKKFKISYKKMNLERLIKLTHKNIIKQAKKFIDDIIKNKIKLNNKFKWKKKAYTKKEFELAREIKLYDSKRNILKKLKAFTYKDYKSVYINLKGIKFEFKTK